MSCSATGESPFLDGSRAAVRLCEHKLTIRFDYDTPIEETMHALHDVVKAGYCRYIGMSSCHAYQFHQMQSTSPLRPPPITAPISLAATVQANTQTTPRRTT